MSVKEIFCKKFILALIILSVLIILLYYFHQPLWKTVCHIYSVLTDREQIKTFITSFGAGAPVVFIIIQILQVLFAPVPGEATGFIGGFLFGVINGFIYSSIGLTIGSLLNFLIGRILGKKYVRKLLPIQYLEKFESYLKHQGIVVIFIFFVFPGFPKDYLCLFLGLTSLPFKVFFILAFIGRMPGTLMLCFQGAYLYEQNYIILGILIVICVVCTFIVYRYRDNVYKWVDKLNHQNEKKGTNNPTG